MGMTRLWTTWLLFGGLAAVFAGARVFDAVEWLNLPLILAGAAAVVAAAGLRLAEWRSAPPEARVAEAVFALAAAGCVLSLAGFVPATQDGLAWLNWDVGGPAEERRFRRIFLVASTTLLACSVLPAAAAHWAAKKGVGARRGSVAAASASALAGARAVDGLRVRETAAHALSLALAGAALMLIGYVGAAANRTLDFSYFKTATPGQATREIVRNLDGTLQVALFFPPSNAVGEQVLTYVRELAGATGNVAVEEHDRLADPEAAENYDARNDGEVFFRFDGRTERIGLALELDDARARLRVLDGQVQQALLLLARGRRTAYLTTGHGELNDPLVQDSLAPAPPREPWMPANAPPGPREPPLGALRRVLELLNYEVREIGARDGLGDRIPDDAAMLMVLGPQRPFFDSEAAAVREYLDRGGSLLLALEPGAQFRLADFRDHLGLEYGAAMLVDDRAHMRETGTAADRRLVVANRFSTHPSVTTLSRRGAGQGVLFLGASELTAAEDVEGLRRTLVVRSMRSTFPDENRDFRFDEATEPRDSYGLAAAVEVEVPPTAPADSAAEATAPTAPVSSPARDPGMRALVYGDAEIFSDRVLVSLQMNAAMVVDGIRWLGNEEAYAGEVESEEDVAILHTRSEDVAWFYAIIFGAPAVVLGAGLAVLRQRRTGRGEAEEAS